MSDSDSNGSNAPPDIAQPTEPSNTQTQSSSTMTTEEQKPEESIMEHARRFLMTEEVNKGTREMKIEFLKSKGISEENIETLLAEQEQPTNQEASSPSNTISTMAVASTFQKQAQIQAPTSAPTTSAPPLPSSMPPIVTYPEFLAAPQKPPPLITVSRLINTLYAATTAGFALYGASKFIVNPMVQNLTVARESLAASTTDKLDNLVAKLEGVVSVLPPPPSENHASNPSSAAYEKGKRRSSRRAGSSDGSEESDSDEDTMSNASDPTELFHRDFGTQTSSSIPSSPVAGASSTSGGGYLNFAVAEYQSQQKDAASKKSPLQTQTESLSKLTSSLRSLSEGIVSQREDAEEISAQVDLLRNDLDKLAYPAAGGGGSDYASSSFAFYGAAYGTEPNDEIKKARDGIRRIKGVLLSARSFPTSVR